MKEKKFYVLWNLVTHIMVNDGSGTQTRKKIDDLEGFLPVYKTLKQAKKAGDGKCEIYQIKVKKQ